MANIFRVSMDRMAEEASRCRDSGYKLQTVLEEIDETVAFLYSSWQGEAVDGYRYRIEDCRQSIVDMITILNQLSKDIEMISTNYREAESNIASINRSDLNTLIES